MDTGGQRTGAVAGCWLALSFLATAATGQAATLGSHYPFGAEGVLAATAPPQGVHYRMYNTWYNPTTLTDDNGDELPVDFDLELFASVQRLIHVTKVKIFGADLLYDIIVPLVDKDLSIGALGISDSQSLTVGDIVLEPFVLAWHEPRWDATFGLAVIAPTGSYDSGEPASAGLGYWSGMLTLGATYYLDSQRTWSISALTRTLVHTEQDEPDVTPGSELVVEYGIGKEFRVGDRLMLRPGLAGSAYWQLEDDSDNGPDNSTIADERKEAYAIGAEVNALWLPFLVQANLRFLHEFGAANTSEGEQVVLTLTKSW